MNKKEKEFTLKLRLMKLLLSCLDWGVNTKWVDNQDKTIQKKLKVQYTFDPRRIRSCIDLIEDTEEAIISFSKYGIEKFSFSLNEDFGGKYLRLYGILNAIQQQRLAIIELYEVLKIPNKTLIKQELDNLKIIEIRNVVGAHTINFNDYDPPKSNAIKTNFFRITQMNITNKADNIIAIDGFQNIRKYNLYQDVLAFNRATERILYEGIFEYIERIFKNVESQKLKLLKHYNIKEFKNHNYEVLYKNDKLEKKQLRKKQKKIKEEMIKELGGERREKLKEN
jgi:hypothetical protein